MNLTPAPLWARRLPVTLVASLLLVINAGCRQQMARSANFHWPDQPSGFFPDKQANRPLEPGTVARGQLHEDVVRTTGQTANSSGDAMTFVTDFPFAISASDLSRGRERYNAFCGACHGRSGFGDGKVVQRGYLKPPSFHDTRLREMPVGRYFDVVTRGWGGMPSYSDMIPIDDRWRIIAYVRALQLSQNLPAAELSAEDRKAIEQAGQPSPKQASSGAEGKRGH